MGLGKKDRVVPRVPRGLRDIFAREQIARRRMMDTIRNIYERYGFAPLETPAFEYVDVLGKYLPESDEPQGGIFAWRDDDEQWIALRYDLTAALSRVVAQNRQFLPMPFRRYQIGPVWRQEKPGPGRFREFYQCDFDTVGTSSPAADAEVCAVLADCFETLGIPRGDYVIKVNNRKVLNGVLDSIGLEPEESDLGARQRLSVLRAIDKLDRLGEDGVLELLGTGRKDESGDYTKGADLAQEQAAAVMEFVRAGNPDRATVVNNLKNLVGKSETGLEGIEELLLIHELLDSMGMNEQRVVFDPSIVRGLAYYTGAVFEGMFTFEVKDKKGRPKPFGSVAGGGRYDNLVERFAGMKIPATGASIGIDRLIAALEEMNKLHAQVPTGPVVVSVMDKSRLVDYQRMVFELRDAGIAAELFLGGGGFKKQIKYADKRNAPIAIIAGGDEFDKDEVSLKDLWLGSKLAKDIDDRDEWRKGQPAQITIPRSDLVKETRKMLERYGKSGDKNSSSD